MDWTPIGFIAVVIGCIVMIVQYPKDDPYNLCDFGWHDA